TRRSSDLKAFQQTSGRAGSKWKVLEQPRPIAIHRLVGRLIVEELRRPFDCVDLGDLYSDDKPSDFEQLVVGNPAIRNDFVRPFRIAQTGIRVRLRPRHAAELIDD